MRQVEWPKTVSAEFLYFKAFKSFNFKIEKE